MFFSLLILAGNETTRNAISGGLVAFLEHRDQWELLGEHPELIDTAVEEILRYTSPVNYFRRTATVDCELGGRSIRAGEKVTLWYPSGNRDESVFDDAHRFDITRSPNHHMNPWTVVEAPSVVGAPDWPVASRFYRRAEAMLSKS